MEIKIAESEAEIRDCYETMCELRPHLSEENFVTQVLRQMRESNFRLVYLNDGEIKAVGGIRVAEWLAGGKSLEVEDLVTKENARSSGCGGALFDWIVEYAKRENCNQIKLVSHVTRYGAHKFYLRKGMKIEAHYFLLALATDRP